MKGTILVIDDEKDLVELVRCNLEREGYDVIGASDGQTGLDIASRLKVDLVVLDLMLPGMDGLDVCRSLRTDNRTGRVPVLMLTARATEADKIVGLELGADDYVTKPFSPRELLARVKALLRRTAQQSQPAEVLRLGELLIDVDRHEVTYDGRTVDLTATEFRILQYMAQRPGRVLSRDDLIDSALGRDEPVLDRTIDVHVTAIRRKLGAGAEMLETVRGFGYRLRQPVIEE